MLPDAQAACLPAQLLQQARVPPPPRLQPVPAHPGGAGQPQRWQQQLRQWRQQRYLRQHGRRRRRRRNSAQGRQRWRPGGGRGGDFGGARRGWSDPERVLRWLGDGASVRRRLQQCRRLQRCAASESWSRHHLPRLAQQGGAGHSYLQQAQLCCPRRAAPGQLPGLRRSARQPCAGWRAAVAAAVGRPGCPPRRRRQHERACVCGQPSLVGAAPSLAARHM